MQSTSRVFDYFTTPSFDRVCLPSGADWCAGGRGEWQPVKPVQCLLHFASRDPNCVFLPACMLAFSCLRFSQIQAKCFASYVSSINSIRSIGTGGDSFVIHSDFWCVYCVYCVLNSFWIYLIAGVQDFGVATQPWLGDQSAAANRGLPNFYNVGRIRRIRRRKCFDSRLDPESRKSFNQHIFGLARTVLPNGGDTWASLSPRCLYSDIMSSAFAGECIWQFSSSLHVTNLPRDTEGWPWATCLATSLACLACQRPHEDVNMFNRQAVARISQLESESAAALRQTVARRPRKGPEKAQEPGNRTIFGSKHFDAACFAQNCGAMQSSDISWHILCLPTPPNTCH